MTSTANRNRSSNTRRNNNGVATTGKGKKKQEVNRFTEADVDSAIVRPMTFDDIENEEGREFILIAGKDGVGKTSAMLTFALMLAEIHPDRQFFIIDTENGFKKIQKAFKNRAPKNIIYYKCSTMLHVLNAFQQIKSEIEPGDWLGVDGTGVSANCGLWPVGRHSAGATADPPRPAADAARRPIRTPPRSSPCRYGTALVALSVRHLARRPVRTAPALALDGARSVARWPGRTGATGYPSSQLVRWPRAGAGAEVPLDVHAGGRGRLSEEI